jgi:TetR/AcrR family transcriptional regulator, cholesterol catabolism regulator
VAKTKMHAVEGCPGEFVSTRNALILAAEDCFSARGFSATSIQDIATQAGVAKGNVYHYFSSKDEVLRLILDKVLDNMLVAFDRIPYDELDFAAQVHAFMRVMINLVGQNRAGVAILVQERRRLVGEAFAEVLVRTDEVVGRLTALLQRGIDQGEIRPLASAKSLAIGLMGLATWVYQWYLPDRLSLTEIADIYTSVVLDGLAVDRARQATVLVVSAWEPAVEELDGAPVTTREALLRAAMDLFVVNGYDNTSINNIAERANVTTGAIYSNFAKKDEILRDIANRFLDRLLASIDRALAQGLPAPETLARFMVEMMGEVGDHRIELTIFLQERPLLATDAFPDGRAKSAQLVQKFVTVLEAGQQQGFFRAVRSPRVMAYGLIGLCSFPFQWSEPGDVVSQGIVQMYAEVILRGLRPRRERERPATMPRRLVRRE